MCLNTRLATTFPTSLACHPNYASPSCTSAVSISSCLCYGCCLACHVSCCLHVYSCDLLAFLPPPPGSSSPAAHDYYLSLLPEEQGGIRVDTSGVGVGATDLPTGPAWNNSLTFDRY